MSVHLGFESEAELKSLLEGIRDKLMEWWRELRRVWFAGLVFGARDFEIRIGLKDRHGRDIYFEGVNISKDANLAFDLLCRLLARFNLAATIHVGPIHRGCWACDTSVSPTRFSRGGSVLMEVKERLRYVVAQVHFHWEDTAIVEIAPSAYDLEDLEKYADWVKRVFLFLSSVCRYFDQEAIYVDAKPIAGWRSRLLRTWLPCNQISQAIGDIGNIVRLLKGKVPERR